MEEVLVRGRTVKAVLSEDALLTVCTLQGEAWKTECSLDLEDMPEGVIYRRSDERDTIVLQGEYLSWNINGWPGRCNWRQILAELRKQVQEQSAQEACDYHRQVSDEYFESR